MAKTSNSTANTEFINDTEFSNILKNIYNNEIQIDDTDEDNWLDNDFADYIDDDIKNKSEKAYISIAKNIVRTSTRQLDVQNKSKNKLKIIFTVFFIIFISIQYIVLASLLFFKGLNENFMLSDAIIITYISSVFVETLSAIIIMIKYAFDSTQENQIINILSNIISQYQKYNNDLN